MDRTRPVTMLKSAWTQARKAAGVRARFHDLRHTAASRVGCAGVSRAAMMRILKHASTALVDRYCHAEEKDLLAAVEALRLRPDNHSFSRSGEIPASGSRGEGYSNHRLAYGCGAQLPHVLLA